MTTQGLVLVLASALLTVAANLLMRAGVLRAGEFSLAPGAVGGKIAALAMQPLFVTGFICYGLAAVVWFRVLSIEDLSTSYPLLVGLTFALVTVGAVVFFHEHVSMLKLLGIATILAGVVVVARA